MGCSTNTCVVNSLSHSYFVKISSRRRHPLMVEDIAFTYTIDYVTVFSAVKGLWSTGLPIYKDDWMNELINYKGFCRSAPATPGLLKSIPCDSRIKCFRISMTIFQFSKPRYKLVYINIPTWILTRDRAVWKRLYIRSRCFMSLSWLNRFS